MKIDLKERKKEFYIMKMTWKPEKRLISFRLEIDKERKKERMWRKWSWEKQMHSSLMIVRKK